MCIIYNYNDELRVIVVVVFVVAYYALCVVLFCTTVSVDFSNTV